MIFRKVFNQSRKDERTIATISEAFEENDRMRVISKRQGRQFKDDIQAIVAYAYFAVKKFGGTIQSSTGRAFLLYYQKSTFHFSIADRLRYLFIALAVVGVNRIKKTYAREQKVRLRRKNAIEYYKDKDFLYVWFLAQKKEEKSLKGLMEVKQEITERSERLAIPIYMETSEERLVRIYERAGFKFYDCLYDHESDMKLWFARYQPAA